MKQLANLLEHPENYWITQCKSQRDEAEMLVEKGWLNPQGNLALSRQESGLILDLLRKGPQKITNGAYMPAVSRLITLGIIEPSDMTKDAYELTNDTLELLGVPEAEPQGVNAILAERQTTYGDFSTQAELSQALKGLIQSAYNERPEDEHNLQDYQCEALEMILHKIARIINGDPSYIDSWADIAGFAQLVVKELEKTEGATNTRLVRQKVINGVLTDVK